MPGDALNYEYMTKELSCIVGGRIEKISALEDTVALSVHTKSGSKTLLICAHPASARLHLCKEAIAGQPTPSSFLLHLRKKIGGGIIRNISAIPFERIIKIEMDCHNEIGMKFSRVLYAEIMGKYSNIILTEDGRITECIKHVTADLSSVRVVLPGLEYTLPPKQEKLTPFDTDDIVRAIEGFDGTNLTGHILSLVYGLAPATVRAYLSGLKLPLPLSLADAERVAEGLRNLYSKPLNPCTLTENGKTEYYFYPLYDNDTLVIYPTLSEAMESVYRQRQQSEAKSAKAARLGLLIKNALARTEKKLSGFMQKQEECKDLDSDRLYGELITANIYKLKTGMKRFIADNYYDGSTVEIPLDEQLSPQKNAQVYYKRYNKKKKTLDNLEIQIKNTQEELERLNSALQSFEFSSEREYTDIETELSEIGLIKKKGRTAKIQPSSPIKTSCMGFTIYIGKNNIQNDRLVRSFDKQDLWLHTKDIHGSHVIIRTEGKSVPVEVIEAAAGFAAFYSKARLSNKVPVDYTLLKNVSKPSGMPPGKVYYTGQKTIYVSPKGITD